MAAQRRSRAAADIARGMEPTNASAPALDPVQQFAAATLLRAQGSGLRMKAAIFDVDGVLTDGRIYIGADGETVKAFSTLDATG